MRKNRLKGIIALAIMIISMVLMYLYLSFGQEAFSTKSVIVTAVDIDQGTVISYEHFTEKKVEDKDLISGSISVEELSSIIGLAATQFIPANSQVVSRYFEKPGIVITEDKFVYKIPNNWIYAVPSSIRRSDEVLIYEIDSRIDQGIDQSIKAIESKTISEKATDYKADRENLPVYEGNVAPHIVIGDKEPIIQTSVIYVKDSANREVVDVDGGNRLDASSQVSSIEIVCTKDDITKLEKKIAEGKKLIIVYR